tara:strand:+ start:731 stop:1183 length:453 start_codon:yes stop_codon:yes gene_type:complete
MSKGNTKPLYGQNMLLTTSNWGPYKTFKLTPVTEDCPYVEVIFDPSSKILAVISKINKSSYHFVPKIDDNGDEVKLKVGKRPNGKDIKEQRVMMQTHAEYYIVEENEIIDFIERFAINADSYDYSTIIKNDVEQMKRALSSEKATNLNLV